MRLVPPQAPSEARNGLWPRVHLDLEHRMALDEQEIFRHYKNLGATSCAPAPASPGPGGCRCGPDAAVAQLNCDDALGLALVLPTLAAMS
jgi:hypothetical protein